MAFRTWWGTSEFLRVIYNFTMWFIMFIFWGLTLIPEAVMQEVFAFIASIMLWTDIFRLCLLVLMKIIAFMADSYKNEYKYYPY